MKEPLKQNSSGLYLIIQKSGCFFRAATHLAEIVAGRNLTVKSLNHIWDVACKYGYIDTKNNMLASAPIANIALEVLNTRGRFVEVATFKNGTMNWYLSVPQSQRRADFFIQKGTQNGPQKVHFYNTDKYGTRTWDPHEPAINITGVVHTICYRYDKEA